MNWVSFLVLCTWTISVSDGANIFIMLPSASYSHQQFYHPYLRELHKRGHNLTVASPNPFRDPTMANYREIDLGYLYPKMKKFLEPLANNHKDSVIFAEKFFVLFTKIIDGMCHLVLSDPNVMDIYKRNEKFDLYIQEWGLYGCFNPFEKLADGKMIGISSFELGTIAQQFLGSPWNPSYVSDIALEYSDRMNFFQRLRSAVYFTNAAIFTWWLRKYETNIARQYFGPDVESVSELSQKVSLVMENSHVTMSYPRPNNINVIPLGGPPFHLNGKRLAPLPKDIKDFLDDAPDGVIYFSLGTNVKTSNISKDEEKILMESFSKIKQKVLWRWETDEIKLNLKNVMKGKWFPQVEVLAHPNVKAFVTQGGLQSVGEAIEYHVPMIMMPFFADQNHNARKMELEGVALYFDFDTLTAEKFTQALNEIVNNKKYKENIVRLSALVKDQPIPPLEKAVWWTEYVIRHNGAPHLRSAAATMPWYQFFMLDVLAFIFLVLFIIFYIIYIILRTLLRFLFKSNKSKKD